ncbi:MAG: hypothetical protein IPP05_21905 [Cytophagaceae bacterium]|nr:hypothetical protein [Cytophagaceae bacterium]
MKIVMVAVQNPLGKNWLCHIPGTDQAYYCPTQKSANIFVEKVNKAFEEGKYRIEGSKIVRL